MIALDQIKDFALQGLALDNLFIPIIMIAIAGFAQRIVDGSQGAVEFFIVGLPLTLSALPIFVVGVYKRSETLGAPGAMFLLVFVAVLLYQIELHKKHPSGSEIQKSQQLARGTPVGFFALWVASAVESLR